MQRRRETMNLMTNLHKRQGVVKVWGSPMLGLMTKTNKLTMTNKATFMTKS